MRQVRHFENLAKPTQGPEGEPRASGSDPIVRGIPISAQEGCWAEVFTRAGKRLFGEISNPIVVALVGRSSIGAPLSRF